VLAEKLKGHGAGRATLMSSSGTAKGWKQAAASILGDAALVDVESVELSSEVSGWTVSGLVSKPTGGRRSRDVQLFFCNQRPIDAPKRVVKLINDTFHQYNSRLWPVVILSFSASTNLVDVNVTPDKRTVFFHNEEELLKDIQAKLTSMYGAMNCETGSIASLSTLSNFGIVASASQNSGPVASAPPQVNWWERNLQPAVGMEIDGLAASSSPSVADGSSTQYHQAALTQEADCKTPGNVTIDLDDTNVGSDTPGSTVSSRRLWQGTSTVETPEKLLLGRASSSSSVMEDVQPAVMGADAMEFQVTEFVPEPSPVEAIVPMETQEDTADRLEGLSVTQIEVLPTELDGMTTAAVDFKYSGTVPANTQPDAEMEDATQQASQGSGFVVTDYSSTSQPDVFQCSKPNLDIVPLEGESYSQPWEVLDGCGMASLPAAPARVSTVHTTVAMAQLEASIARRRQAHATKLGKKETQVTEPCLEFPNAFSLSSLRADQGSASLDEVAKFAASGEAGGAAGANVESDSALLQFDKSCFSKMRVIGQFNLGFIIAALKTKGADKEQDGQDSTPVGAMPKGLQLFIIDQHASDEKFRFEALNRESKIDRQPLVSPHFLQLTPAQEQLAESHLDIFKLNGFILKKDDSRPPGRRFQVTTLPSCKGLMFEDKDIHELLYTLEQAESEQSDLRIKEPSQKSGGLLDLAGHRGLWSSTALPRPPKVWKMLANRACRHAIMIGKALRLHEMEKVLANLGTLEQPWNCPHGRPTMRHLIDTAVAWQAPNRSEPLAGFLSAAPAPLKA